jgi:hypothetical protein
VLFKGKEGGGVHIIHVTNLATSKQSKLIKTQREKKGTLKNCGGVSGNLHNHKTQTKPEDKINLKE